MGRVNLDFFLDISIYLYNNDTIKCDIANIKIGKYTYIISLRLKSPTVEAIIADIMKISAPIDRRSAIPQNRVAFSNVSEKFV
jgi:hypothetical protein